MRQVLIAVLLLSIAESRVSGQLVGTAEQKAAALSAAIERGDALAVRSVVEHECSDALSKSLDSSRLVAERATSARIAFQCARARSAAIVLMAAPDKALQLRELLATAQEEYAENLKKAESDDTFLGLRWGLGLGISLGADENIDDAEIVDGVVRVKSDLRNQPRALFEYHKFFWCNKKGTSATQGCGPFVAAAATEKKILSGVGLGLMYGKRSKATDAEGFSLGVGALLDASVKNLGDGFARNAAPPSGATTVRFATRSRWSTLVFVSRTF